MFFNSFLEACGTTSLWKHVLLLMSHNRTFIWFLCFHKSMWEQNHIARGTIHWIIRIIAFAWNAWRFAIACALLLLLVLLVTLPALSKISGNLEQKTILQTTEQLIQFTVLEIQFPSLKYMTVIGIRKNLSSIPFLSKRYLQGELCWCKQPTSNCFETLKTVYTYSNCTINQLCCWKRF